MGDDGLALVCVDSAGVGGVQCDAGVASEEETRDDCSGCRGMSRGKRLCGRTLIDRVARDNVFDRASNLAVDHACSSRCVLHHFHSIPHARLASSPGGVLPSSVSTFSESSICSNFSSVSREHTYIWHVRPYAGWLIALVTLLWLWTWVIVRGIGRVILAAVLGEWYFHR